VGFIIAAIYSFFASPKSKKSAADAESASHKNATTPLLA
jgi:hypothetical protein